MNLLTSVWKEITQWSLLDIYTVFIMHSIAETMELDF
jgi:hypothetical protein